MGRHSKPEPPDMLSPLVTRPDGSWAPPDDVRTEPVPAVEDRPVAGPAVQDERAADFAEFWGAAEDAAGDLLEDGRLSETARERLVRAGRTLLQGIVAAALVGAAPVALDVLKGDPTDVRGAASAFVTAAVAAVLAYVHKRK